MSRYAIALGSNLGDRLAHLQSAIDAISSWGDVEAISSLYETEPVGGPEQGAFYNAVVVVRTPLPPDQVLDACHQIEAQARRTRQVRWGPRTLDLDIVAWDGAGISSARLEIPHPRAHQRRFVLEPLVEIWPEVTLANGLDALTNLAHSDGEVERLSSIWHQPDD